MNEKTCVCGFCGTEFPSTDEAYHYCSKCEDDMEVVIIEETETEGIDKHYTGISRFETLEFITQYKYIIASSGTDEAKYKKLCEYIDRM